MRYRKILVFLVSTMMVVSVAACSAAENVDQSSITSLKLHLPEQKYNTEVRWWLSQGHHTDETIIESIQEIYEAGFAQVEFAMLNEPNVDATVFGYGSDEWVHDVKLILRETTKRGMGVSFTSGTHWATANIPGLDQNSDAALQAFAGTERFVPAGTHFGNDPVEKPRTRGAVTEQTLINVVAYKLDGEYRPDASWENPMKLYSDSAIDLTGLVTEDLRLDWTAPKDGDYIVFAFFKQGAGHTSSPAVEQSVCVNYFDREGFEALKKYWESYLFADKEIVDLIRQNGNVQMFMDSLEIGTSPDSYCYWSKDMAEEFIARKGYDIRPYLPLFLGAQNPFRENVIPYVGRFDFTGEDGPTLRRKIRNDLYDVQTAVYMEYMMTPLKAWLNEEYGIKLRAQISYGQYLELSLPIQVVDYAENESRNTRDQTDCFRLHAGGAHLLDKLFSSETGADNNMNYGYSMQEYLQKNYQQYAGGVQRTIWHGYASIFGPKASVEWPGYEAGMRNIAGRWGVREPAYKDYLEFNNHLGRIQTVLRAGKPRVDLAILYLDYGYFSPHRPGHLEMTEPLPLQRHFGYYWTDCSLQDAGYTYDYFAPQYLERDDVQYSPSEAVLASDGPAYRALLVYQEMIPVSSAKALLEMAKQGLKVVVVEGAMTKTPFYDGREQELAAIVAELKALSSVVVVPTQSDAYEALLKMGVRPRAEFVEPNQELLTVVREDDDAVYLWLNHYCDGRFCGLDHGHIETEIMMEGLFKPYALDTWTGEIRRVNQYRYENGRTIVPVDLSYRNVAVYIFSKKLTEEPHVVYSNASDIVFKDGRFWVRETDSGAYLVVMNDGSTSTVRVEAPPAVELKGWDLTVEKWSAPEPTDENWIERTEVTEFGNVVSEGTWRTKKDTIKVHLDQLKTWNNIPEIGKEVCGIGYYKTTFNWDASVADGAYLDLGPIVQTVTVHVNGVKSKPVDITKAVVDISDLLVDGENTLEITITTPLANWALSEGNSTNRPELGYKWDGPRPDQEWKYFDHGLPQAILIAFVDAEI